MTPAIFLCLGDKRFLEFASQLGLPAIVTTNRFGIQRGLFDWKAYLLVTDQLNRMLGLPGAIIEICVDF